MPRPLEYLNLLEGEPVWLVTVTFGGQVVRLSSEPLRVSSDDGSLFFEGGMDALQFEDAVRGLSDDPELLSLSVSAIFPHWINVPQMTAQGHQLSGAVAEVALITVGSTWEARRVVVRGAVTQPEHGARDEPVTFSIEEHAYSDRSQIPEAGAVLSVDRFPAMPSDDVGKYGPIVFGRPGLYNSAWDGELSHVSATPARAYTTTIVIGRALIASHHVHTDQIRIWDSSGGYEDWYTGNDVDELGRPFAWATDTVGAPYDLNGTDTEFRIGWGHGYGLLNDDGGPVRGAGDLIVWMLNRSTLTVDHGRWSAVRTYLNRYEVSGYIDDPASAWEWIQDNLLPLLPVSIRTGPDGLYPVIWKWDATRRDVVAALVAGEGLTRDGPISATRQPTEVLNEIRLEFAPGSGVYNRTMVLTGDPDPGDRTQWTNHYTRASRSRYGLGSKSIDTDIVYLDSTASLILTWMAYFYGGIPREVKYQAAREWAWLEAGMVVTITDAELYLEAQICLVESVTWSPDAGVSLKLVILDRPLRDAIPV